MLNVRASTIKMYQQLRMMSAIGAFALSAMAAVPALAQGTFPSSAQEFSSHFWTERMMKAMDSNKDGMVSRDEYMAYMGKQYDVMDTGKKRMLTAQQFMDKKMMSSTFPFSVNESGPR
jgi:hypothetical protein